MNKNTVRVYDTISKKIVEVEVSNGVRTHYNRTQTCNKKSIGKMDISPNFHNRKKV